MDGRLRTVPDLIALLSTLLSPRSRRGAARPRVLARLRAVPRRTDARRWSAVDIVEAVVSLAHRLGMRSIAEGVEPTEPHKSLSPRLRLRQGYVSSPLCQPRAYPILIWTGP